MFSVHADLPHFSSDRPAGVLDEALNAVGGGESGILDPLIRRRSSGGYPRAGKSVRAKSFFDGFGHAEELIEPG